MKRKIVFLLAEVVSNNNSKEFLKKYNTPHGKFKICFVLSDTFCVSDRTKACRTGHMILVIDQ